MVGYTNLAPLCNDIIIIWPSPIMSVATNHSIWIILIQHDTGGEGGGYLCWWAELLEHPPHRLLEHCKNKVTITYMSDIATYLQTFEPILERYRQLLTEFWTWYKHGALLYHLKYLNVYCRKDWAWLARYKMQLPCITDAERRKTTAICTDLENTGNVRINRIYL